MKRILVCTDFSSASDEVLKTAEELRKRNQGSLHLVHVSEVGLHLDEAINEAAKNSYQSVVLGSLRETFLNKLRDQLKRTGAQGEVLLKDGNFEEEVLKLANSNEFDLIVMGHGRRPQILQILGSNAFKLVSSTPLPLLIVKAPGRLTKVTGLLDESRPLDRVIIGAYDFVQNFNCPAVNFIGLWMDFPVPFGSPHDEAAIRLRVEQEVKHYAPKGVKADVYLAPTKELKLAYPLEKIMKEGSTDVAVMKRFTEGNLKRVYIGSTTKRLLEIFEGNLLILPP